VGELTEKEGGFSGAKQAGSKVGGNPRHKGQLFLGPKEGFLGQRSLKRGGKESGQVGKIRNDPGATGDET